MHELGSAHGVGMAEKPDRDGDRQPQEEYLMVSPSSPAFVITVSGVSGAGKSSTVRAIAEQLGNAVCFYFDDYGEAMKQPDDGLAWIAAGADLTEFVLPEFARDLQALCEGQVVTTPNGRRVEPAPFLVVEEPFGNGREDMASLVDFVVCIDLPMEIALARRLLEAMEIWGGEASERLQWMVGYLRSYLFEGMREVYISINERVKQNSHLVLDGMQPVEHNAKTVVAALEARRRVTGPVQ